MGSETGSVAGAVGIFTAVLVHGAAVLLTYAIPPDDVSINAAMATLVIDVTQEEAPPPPPPEPEPVAEIPPPPEPPPPPPKPAEPEDPYEDIATPPAEAAKILTAPTEPNEPPAPPEQGFASGNGDGLGFGMVAGSGDGDAPTYDPRARVAPPPKDPNPPASKQPPTTTERDLSRPASPIYGFTSDCFPDGASVDTAVVQVAVTVSADGKAMRVEVLSDPGQGFGAAARVCAMMRSYRPARDKAGRPVTSKTPPFRIRFTR
jgi:protein TonB